MVGRDRRFHPALKHAAYSGTTLLPGEDPAAFAKLHAELIGEFAPVGPLEEEIVSSVAHLIWRKQNLSTYRLAEQASNRVSAIYKEVSPPMPEFSFPSDTRDR
jgi:hypothetical protein